MPKKPTLIIVFGPTAVGKTAVGITLAQALNTEIVSADSRQVFAEMNIGTAKPSIQQLQAVKHHFISSHSIHSPYNAGLYENEALQKLQTIFKSKPTALLVGGTGLYIDAICNGFDDLPKADPSLRTALQAEFEQKGLLAMQQELQQLDPACFKEIDLSNTHRLMRAIEVCRLSGKPYSTLRLQQQKERPFVILKIGIDLPRTTLYQHIDHRVDMMMEEGLLEEARQLYPFKHLNALKTVGYTELFDYFDGNINLEKAIELIKQNSRRYAKRQLTWFRKYTDASWFTPQQTTEILDFIKLTTGQ